VKQADIDAGRRSSRVHRIGASPFRGGGTCGGAVGGNERRTLRVMPRKSLYLSGDPKADALLTKDPLALLVGMVLDQHIQ